MKIIEAFQDTNKKRKGSESELESLPEKRKTINNHISTEHCAVEVTDKTAIENITGQYTGEAESSKDKRQKECPVCNETFLHSDQLDFENHVNKCLDNNNEKESQSTSWTRIFGEQRAHVKGIWSAKEDSAPGLTKNDIEWFGKAGDRKTVPYYKYLAGTNLVVDAFSFGKIPGCEGYFLSHFHSDHYTKLNASWAHGPIYCSEITSRLVQKRLRVIPEFIHPLPLNEPCIIPGTDNASVTLIDANHCPGSVMFLCTVPQDNGPDLKYLHTGDFRACSKICSHPLLKQSDNSPIDILYLDTTYLDPKYSFPSQTASIRLACDVVERHIHHNGDLLSDTSHLFTQKRKSGKSLAQQENLVFVVEIAKKLKSKIFVTERKLEILSCFNDDDLNKMLTDEPKEAQVHVIPLWDILPENLETYFRSLQPHFTQMIAFKPTGWTFRTQSSLEQDTSLDAIISTCAGDIAVLNPSYDSPILKIYEIPYSEHSSFRELALFIASLDIRRIVPTVNVHNEESRAKMGALFNKWQKEKKKRKIAVINNSSLNNW